MSRPLRSNFVIYEVVIEPRSQSHHASHRSGRDRDQHRHQHYPEPAEHYERPPFRNEFNHPIRNQDFEVVYDDELDERDYQRQSRRNHDHNQFQGGNGYHDQRPVYQNPYPQDRQMPSSHRYRPEPEPEQYNSYEIEYENHLRRQARLDRAAARARQQQYDNHQYDNRNYDPRDQYTEDDYDESYTDESFTDESESTEFDDDQFDDPQFDRRPPVEDPPVLSYLGRAAYRHVSMHEYDRIHYGRAPRV